MKNISMRRTWIVISHFIFHHFPKKTELPHQRSPPTGVLPRCWPRHGTVFFRARTHHYPESVAEISAGPLLALVASRFLLNPYTPLRKIWGVIFKPHGSSFQGYRFVDNLKNIQDNLSETTCGCNGPHSMLVGLGFIIPMCYQMESILKLQYQRRNKDVQVLTPWFEGITT